MCSQLGFQHNCSDLRFSRYESRCSLLLKWSHDTLLMWVRIKWRSPLVTRGLQATIRSMNQTCSKSTQHSRCALMFAFAIYNSLIVSARSARLSLCSCTIYSQNCSSLISTPVRFLGSRTCPKITNSIAKTRCCSHSSWVTQKAQLFLSKASRLVNKSDKNFNLHSFVLPFCSMTLLLIPMVIDNRDLNPTLKGGVAIESIS